MSYWMKNKASTTMKPVMNEEYGIPQTQLDRYNADVAAMLSEAEVRTFKKGEVVLASNIYEDERSTPIAFVVKGLVAAISRGQPDSHEWTNMVNVYGDRQWIGLHALVHNTMVLRYAALTDVEVVFKSIDWFWEEMPVAFAKQTVYQTAIDEMDAITRVHSQFADTNFRLITILSRIRRLTQLEEISITLDQLSSLTGISHARLIKASKVLESMGAIEKGYGLYWIAGFAKLREVARLLLEKSRAEEAAKKNPFLK